jgi:hypothetical protein
MMSAVGFRSAIYIGSSPQQSSSRTHSHPPLGLRGFAHCLSLWLSLAAHQTQSRIPHPTTTRGRQLLSTIRAISSRFPAREDGEEVPSKSPGLRSARGL